MCTGYVRSIEHKKRWRILLRLDGESGTGCALGGDQHLKWPKSKVGRRQDVELGRTDVIQIDWLPVHSHTDSIQCDRHPVANKIRSSPDSRALGQRRASNNSPGIGRNCGAPTEPVLYARNDRTLERSGYRESGLGRSPAE